MTTRLLFAMMLINGTLLGQGPAPCLAQEEAEDSQQPQEERQWRSTSRQVLVENCNLELSVINMVEAAQDEVAASSDPEGLLVRWRLTRPGTRISPRVEICTLTAEWEGNADDVSQAQEAWSIARTNIEAALRSMQQAAIESRNDAFERQTAELRNQQDDYIRQLDNLQTELAAISGPYSENYTRAQFEAGASKRQELGLERVGVAARREAIEERIDDLRKIDSESAKDDPVIAELRKLVAIREEQFANVKALHEAGQRAASSMDMRTAQAEVAHARIEMLRAERAAGEAVNGPLLRELNNELSKLIIRDAELEAMRDAVEEQSMKFKDLIESADQRALLTQQADALRRVVGSLEGEMRELRNESKQPEGPITIKPLADALPKP